MIGQSLSPYVSPWLINFTLFGPNYLSLSFNYIINHLCGYAYEEFEDITKEWKNE
jgi:hypothetical protein